MPYEPGDRVGDYQILSILGAGGMGRVYKVRNTISDRVEAMKILLPNLAENKELGDRFMREIKLQATLSHPNIAALHTALHHENQMLMLVEFVEGVALDALIRSGPLAQDDAVNYMAQVLDALAYAHSKGVIHRDLKPANMMLTKDGTIKLLDFGIAKMTSDSSLTKTGFLVGSLPYISPEQIEGLPDIDGRTDIYSLGVTLYQALTGKVPFQAESEYSLMRKHLQEAPVPPSELLPGVTQGLNDIVMKALEKKREHRYQNAAEMAAALRGLSRAGGAGARAAAAAAPAPPKPAPAQAAPPPPPPPAPAAAPYAPPPAAPAAAAYAPPPPAAVESRKPSNRGLYIALGSVVTVVVLVVAAMQLPKFMGTKAASQVENAGGAQTPAVTPQPAQAQQPAAAETAPPVAAADAGTAAAGAGAGNGVKPAEPQRNAGRGVAVGAGPASPQRQYAQPAGGGAVVMRQQPVQAQPGQTQPEPAASQAQPAADASRAALAEVREQLMLLGTRVTAAQHSLNRLKQEQARQGLGLRGDIASLAQRVEYYMDECEAAVKRGDAAAAKKYLDSAERDTSKLESFLGR
jgi:serine/threonine-protein kinase